MSASPDVTNAAHTNSLLCNCVLQLDEPRALIKLGWLYDEPRNCALKDRALPLENAPSTTA